MTLLTVVVAQVQVAGAHRWPEAPPERSYLAARHRHVFHVKLTLGVQHDRREVEVHDLGVWILERLVRLASGTAFPGVLEFGTLSCEQIAGHLVRQAVVAYPGRGVTCEVLEDGEMGAIVASGAD